MGKSYARKYRICNTVAGMKRYASKAVRRYLKTDCLEDFDSLARNAYKKIFSSYDINDGGRAKRIPRTTINNSWWTTKVKRK